MARPQHRLSLGVQIQMTKQFLLAAASVATIAFAGAAVAGEISGTVGGENFTKTAPYKVASEVIVDATTNAKSGAFVATLVKDASAPATPLITVGQSAQRDHIVTFTVKGATLTNPTVTSVATGGTVTSTLLSNNATTGKATFVVTVSGAPASDAVVTSLSLNGTITQHAQAPVTVSSLVEAVIGSSTYEVDSADAVKAVEYSALLKSVSVDESDVFSYEAELPDYTTLAGQGASATLSQDFVAVNSGTLYKNLAGDEADVAEVLGGAVVTVKGPAINDDVTVALENGASAALGVQTNPESNTAVFTLNSAQAAAFATGDNYLKIANSGDDAFRLGKYRLTWAPNAATGYTVPSSSSADAGSITLEGTNFVAPWFSNANGQNSVVRIANSNSVESGAVTVRLLNAVKVENGVTTPVSSTVVYDAGVVPAGGDLQITTNKLQAAFGTFTRGDIQVTINSTEDGLTAKMRVANSAGQTYEQSIEPMQ